MKKSKFIIVALALAASVSVSVNANADTKDELCLAYGSMAAIVSEMNNGGRTLKDIIKVIDGHNGSDAQKRVFRQIANYVYTMQYDPQDARKMVYLKCGSGSYD